MHGFALNVSLTCAVPPSFCGIAGCRVNVDGQLLICTRDGLSSNKHIVAHFAERFHLDLVDTFGG